MRRKNDFFNRNVSFKLFNGCRASNVDLGRKRYMENLCEEWKKILGLAHWQIEVQIVHADEINNARGQNDYSFVDEQSLIRIKRAEDYHGYFPQDMEQTLVHELLHLVLDVPSLGDDTVNVYYEQALNRIAYALVRLKRVV